MGLCRDHVRFWLSTVAIIVDSTDPMPSTSKLLPIPEQSTLNPKPQKNSKTERFTIACRMPSSSKSLAEGRLSVFLSSGFRV